MPIAVESRPSSAPFEPAHRPRAYVQALAQRIGPAKTSRWFAEAQFERDDRGWHVVTANRFLASWIESRFMPDLRAVAQTVDGAADVQVRVQATDPGAAAHAAIEPKPAERVPTMAPDDLAARINRSPVGAPVREPAQRLPRLCRLEDFVVGESNRLAHAAALRLADDPNGSEVSPLFIHGGCGLGKTHLLQGICRRFLDAGAEPASVRYVTGEQFTNEYIAAVRMRGLDSFRHRMRRLALLAIDDVHFLSNKVKTQSEFLHTLDAIDLSGARIVLASDEHPRCIRKISQSLISRFVAGMVVQIDRPDRALRLELIHRLASSAGVRMNEGAAELVAANCVGSVRELEGAVTKLAAMHSINRAPGGPTEEGGNDIGVVLTRQLFASALARASATPVRLSHVIEAACGRLSVARHDLLGQTRHRRVVLARSIIAHLARELTSHSFPEIAAALGRSFHSAVHAADRRLRRDLASNISVSAVLDQPGLCLRELVDQVRHAILHRAPA